jgi:hypothetical protein
VESARSRCGDVVCAGAGGSGSGGGGGAHRDHGRIIAWDVVIQNATGLDFKKGLGEACVAPEELLNGAYMDDADEVLAARVCHGAGDTYRLLSTERVAPESVGLLGEGFS